MPIAVRLLFRDQGNPYGARIITLNERAFSSRRLILCGSAYLRTNGDIIPRYVLHKPPIDNGSLLKLDMYDLNQV